MVRTLVLAVVVAGLAACSGSSGDPFIGDLKAMCNPPTRDDLPPDLARMEAMRDLAKKIKTPEGARLAAAVIQAAPEDRPALLAEPMKRAGLTRCALLER